MATATASRPFLATCDLCGVAHTIARPTLPLLVRGMDAHNMLADAPAAPRTEPSGIPFASMEPREGRTITSPEALAALAAYEDCPERGRRVAEGADPAWSAWIRFLGQHSYCTGIRIRPDLRPAATRGSHA